MALQCHGHVGVPNLRSRGCVKVRCWVATTQAPAPRLRHFRAQTCLLPGCCSEILGVSHHQESPFGPFTAPVMKMLPSLQLQNYATNKANALFVGSLYELGYRAVDFRSQVCYYKSADSFLCEDSISGNRALSQTGFRTPDKGTADMKATQTVTTPGPPPWGTCAARPAVPPCGALGPVASAPNFGLLRQTIDWYRTLALKKKQLLGVGTGQ